MMRAIALFALVATMYMHASAQDILGRFGNRPIRREMHQMLAPTASPEGFTVRHPATFVSIDRQAFAVARQIEDNVPFTMTFDLPTIGVVEAVVARYRVIDESTELLAMTSNGPVRIPPPQSVLVRGTIPSMKGSTVIAAIYPDWATAMITTGEAQGDRTFQMSPLEVSSAQPVMIIYDQSSVPARNEWACHTKDPEKLPVRLRKDKSSETTQVRYRKLKIAIECDEPYYIDHGRNLNKATQYAESVVAASSAVYERDVLATFVVSQLTVWTTADPYPGTTSSTLLNQFTSRWSQNFGTVDRTLAHLLSGINGLGGVAYLDVLCDKQFGYAVSGLNNNITYPAAGYVWDTDVFSHETGHNIGSPHTFNCWWNPPIDSCVNAEGGSCYTGTKAVKGTIMSYCHLTAQGTNLNFHPRVQDLLKSQLLNDACTPLTYELRVEMPDTIRACQNGVVRVSAIATAGAEPYTYRWYSAFFDTTTTTNSFLVRQPGNYTFYVDVRDAVGNAASDTCVMRRLESPNATLVTESIKVCSGKSADILCEVTGGKPPYTYQWLRNGVPINNLTEFYAQRIDEPTRFTVIVADSNGCVDSAQVEIRTYDIQLTFSPSTLSLPSLPACKNSFIQEYTLTNIGADTIVIDSIVHGPGVKVVGNLPILLAPGAYVKTPLTISVFKTGTIREDIAFLENRCRWRFRGSITGSRSTARVQSTLPVQLGTKIQCDSVTPRMIPINIANSTSFPLSISAVYCQEAKTAVRLERTPFTLAPGAERPVVIFLTTDLPVGSYVDTLTLTYESESCEGSFRVPLTFGVSSAVIAQPAAISFDSVKTSSKPIVRTLPITATLTGTTTATVQYVEITSPFTTSMKVGLQLPNNRVTNVSVTLDPKDILVDGPVTGKLLYLVDSCSVPYTVDLNANVIVVGVDDDARMADGFLSSTVRAEDGAIVILGLRGSADVFDLNGRRVGGAKLEGAPARVDGLAVGCYVVVLRDDGAAQQQSVVTCIIR